MAALEPEYRQAAEELACRDAADLITDDDDNLHKLRFKAVSGVRMRRTREMLKDKSTIFAMRLVCVSTEVNRAIAYLFQILSEGKLRFNRPALCDLVSPSTSPIYQCGQYIAALIKGRGPALRTVWQMGGATTIQQWAADSPDQVMKVRRALLYEAAAMSSRHGFYLEAPYNFARLVDDRVSAAEQSGVINEFESLPFCCHRPGAAQQLRSKGAKLDTQEGKQFCFAFALATTLSISDVERKHKATRVPKQWQ